MPPAGLQGNGSEPTVPDYNTVWAKGQSKLVATMNSPCLPSAQPRDHNDGCERDNVGVLYPYRFSALRQQLLCSMKIPPFFIITLAFLNIGYNDHDVTEVSVVHHFPDNATPFNGTKIYPQSQGMDIMEDVCLVPGWQGGQRKNSELHSFTNDAQPLKTSVWRYMSKPAGYSTWMTITKGHNVSEWKMWLSNQNIKFVKEETLFVLDMWGNPGHCLTDIVFSIFLDAYNTNDACTTHNAASTKPATTSGFDYPKFQPAHFTSLGPQRVPKSHWCWNLLWEARILDIDNFNRNIPNSSDVPLQTVCFHKLLMPLPQVHRFPIDWTDPRATSDLLASSGVRGTLAMKEFIPDANKATQPCITESLYPASALHRARQRIFQSIGDNIVKTASWVDNETATDIANEEDTPILFYGRQHTRNRVWSNQATVQQVLERDYRVRITTADDTWNSLTPAEQARLYHKYARIVAPHGAHLANLIYCRNGTRVVEIILAPASNVLTMDGDDPSKPLSDWYGPHTWYSFARRIGLHHFAYGESNATGGYHAKAFNISSIDDFVAFLASRLQLTKREKSTAQ